MSHKAERLGGTPSPSFIIECAGRACGKLHPVPGTDPNTVHMILALESSYSSERDTRFKRCEHTREFLVLWFLLFSCNFVGKRWDI